MTLLIPLGLAGSSDILPVAHNAERRESCSGGRSSAGIASDNAVGHLVAAGQGLCERLSEHTEQAGGGGVREGMFYQLTMASVLAALALSGNTAFADFPRLTRMIALNDDLPHTPGICRRARYHRNLTGGRI